MTQWDESGRVWEENHGLLDDEQVAKCERADVAEPLRSPVPTRMISNGEYMPFRKRTSNGESDAHRSSRRRSEQEARRQPPDVSRKFGGHGGRLRRDERGVRTHVQRQPHRAVRACGVRAIGAAEGSVRLRRSIAFRSREHAISRRVRPSLRGRPPRRPSQRIPSTRRGSATSSGKSGVSGTLRSLASRLTRATLTSRSSSRTCISTARSRSAC